MLTKTEVKNVLLLCPQKLTENDGIIQSLHILKSTAGINFKAVEADMRELNKFFPNLQRLQQTF
jgi:hypothetical protein